MAGLLFFASHGAGSGHLARAVTLARMSPVASLVLTEVPSVDLYASVGVPVIYTPGADYLLAARHDGDRHLEPEILSAVAAVGAVAVVFDGNRIPPALWRASQRLGLALVWIRREMWRQGQGMVQAADVAFADRIILPGELAGDDARREDPEAISLYPPAKVIAVDPITTIDAFGLLPRDEARGELGLAPDERAVLLLPGTAPFGTPAPLSAAVRGALPDGTRVLAPGSLGDGIERISTFPISRLFTAFDLVVSAAGYNSFHELARAGVPTVFVPSEHSQLEDQLARARSAERDGWARCVRHTELARFAGLLPALLDRSTRLKPPPSFGSGAGAALEAIAESAGTKRR